MHAEDGRSKELLSTPHRRLWAQKTAPVGCADVQSCDEANNASSSQSGSVNNNSNFGRRDSRHNDDSNQHSVDLDDSKPVLQLADSNPSDGCHRLKKSVSFRAESGIRRSRSPEGTNGDCDKRDRMTNSVYRSLPRPARQLTCQRPQHSSSTSNDALCGTSAPDQTSLRRDWQSVKAVLRDLNNNNLQRDARGSGRSRSCDPGGKRSTRTAVQADAGITKTFNNSSTECHPTLDGRADRRPTSINWFVDLTDGEIRASTSPGSTTSGRQHRCDCSQNAYGASSKQGWINAVDRTLEAPPEETANRAAWREAACGRRGRATTRSTTMDQPRHHDAINMATTAFSADSGEKKSAPTLRPRTSSSPKASSVPRTSGEVSVFQRSSTSQFRRSAMRPKYSETLMHAGEKPTERDFFRRGSTRTRSVSLSEQYRMLLGRGDWFDNLATSSAISNPAGKPTPVNDQLHKPAVAALSRQLKPDFVIYV